MANKRILGFLFSLALLLLVVSLAGCGQNAVTETEVPTSIVIVIPEDPPSFNPVIVDTGYDELVSELVLLSLTDLDPDGTVITELAAHLPTLENGEVVIDEEAWTMDVTWQLRQDVTWQDGESVNADDVLFTYEAMANPETGRWVPGLDYIDSVEKIDEWTIVVHYNSIYPGYLLQFGGDQVMIWPSHYCNAAQGFSDWDCAHQPLSDGPYILEEWIADDHLSFARNPNYYQAGKPTIDQIIVRVVPEESDRRTMLTQGEAHVIPWVTESNAHDFEGQSNVFLSISPTNRWVMRLIPNLAARGTLDPAATPHPILSDVRVRQAIRSAIDTENITQNLYFGYSQPTWSEFFRPPYNHCDIPRLVYDPEAARALLESAGWIDADSDGVRECHGCATAEDGYVMELEFVTYSEFGEVLVLTEQLISDMLSAIGIRTRLTVMEAANMWADYASGGTEQLGDFDLDMYDDGYSGVDPTDFLWLYYSADAAAPDVGWNVGRWYNEEFNTLLEEAYTLDETYRQEIFCRMAEIMDEELPQILLFTTINADVYNVQLTGPRSSANDMITWNVADWVLNSP